GYRRASDMERFAASAAALLVRIPEDEARLDLLLDVVHLGTQDEQRGLGIDQNRDAVLLDQLVHRVPLVGIFEGVAEPRAALAAHADSDAERGLAALAQKLLHAQSGGFSQLDCLGTRSCQCLVIS